MGRCWNQQLPYLEGISKGVNPFREGSPTIFLCFQRDFPFSPTRSGVEFKENLVVFSVSINHAWKKFLNHMSIRIRLECRWRKKKARGYGLLMLPLYKQQLQKTKHPFFSFKGLSGLVLFIILIHLVLGFSVSFLKISYKVWPLKTDRTKIYQSSHLLKMQCLVGLTNQSQPGNTHTHTHTKPNSYLWMCG